MIFPDLYRKEIEDMYVQENFRRIADYFSEFPLDLCNFKFFELVTPNPIERPTFSYPATITFQHNLGYVPSDILVLSTNPSTASVVFKFENFTAQNLVYTASAYVKIRALIGRHPNV